MTSQPEAARILTFEEKIAGSSQVKTCSYEPEARKLHAVFKSTPAFEYVYNDFPPEKWIELQAAPSIGSYLIKNVTRRPAGGGDLPYQFEKLAI